MSTRSRTLLALAVAGALGLGTAQAVVCDETGSMCFSDPSAASLASSSGQRFDTHYGMADLSATGGFEWVLDAPLVSYYLPDPSLIRSADAEPVFVTFYEVEPPLEIFPVDMTDAWLMDSSDVWLITDATTGEQILITPSETWMIVKGY